MKTLLPLILFVGLFSSCTSEYEERFEEGKVLIDRLDFIEERQDLLSEETIRGELSSIRNEISILAKLSGNEELFLTELKKL